MNSNQKLVAQLVEDGYTQEKILNAFFDEMIADEAVANDARVLFAQIYGIYRGDKIRMLNNIAEQMRTEYFEIVICRAWQKGRMIK